MKVLRGQGAYRACLRAARAAARLAPELGPRRAATVRENLRIVYGRVDPELFRAIYRHFATALVDLLFFERMFDPARFTEHFRFEGGGLEDYRAHMDAGGPGAVLVTGHFGNWEIYNAAYHHLDLPLAFIARKPDKVWMARWVGAFRRTFATQVISKKDGARDAIKALRDGARVAFLIDQAAGRHGVPLPFFGRAASTFTTPAALAHKLDVPLYVGYSTRLGDGLRYRCVMERVPLAADPETTTSLLNRYLEGYVRAAPEQWWWFHRRFKPRRLEQEGKPLSAAGVPLAP